MFVCVYDWLCGFLCLRIPVWVVACMCRCVIGCVVLPCHVLPCPGLTVWIAQRVYAICSPGYMCIIVCVCPMYAWLIVDVYWHVYAYIHVDISVFLYMPALPLCMHVCSPYVWLYILMAVRCMCVRPFRQCACMYVRLCLTPMHFCIDVCVCMHVSFLCVCMPVCIYACLYVCMYGRL